MTETTRIWTEAAAHAAKKAKKMRWLVFTIFTLAAGWIFVNYILGPVLIPLGRRVYGIEVFTDAENLAAWRAMNLKLVDAAPLIALLWGLWSANVYLRRVEQGELWSADGLAVFARIGDALWATAAWFAVFAPTIKVWILMRAPFDFALDPLIVTLAGLGIALSLIARVFEDILRGAERLKQDAEDIV